MAGMRAAGDRERARGKMARARGRPSGRVIAALERRPRGGEAVRLPACTAPRSPPRVCRWGVLPVCGATCPRAVGANGALAGGGERRTGGGGGRVAGERENERKVEGLGSFVK